MGTEFIGVVVGNEYTVSVCMAKSKDKVVISDAIVEKRTDSMLDDCNKLVSKYSLDQAPIGIAALGERQEKVMVIPSLSRLEIHQMLQWSVPEFVTWPEDTYYFDFVSIDLPNKVKSSGNDKLVYVVALKKAHITDLATGVLKGGGNLKIIDYAPGPIAHRFIEKEGAVIGFVVGNILELTGWYNCVCLCSQKIPLNEVDLIKNLEEMDIALFSYGISGISGVYLYESQEWRLPKEELDTIYDKYGKLTHISLEQTDDIKIKENLIIKTAGAFLWDMAIGMAYRGIMKKNN